MQQKRKHFRRWILPAILIVGIAAFLLFKMTRARGELQINPFPDENKGKRVLIITMQGSGGHMSAAKAIKANLKEYQCDLLPMDNSENNESLMKTYEEIMQSPWRRVVYNFYAPFQWHFAYLSDFIYPIMMKILPENKYAAIISVVPWLHREIKNILLELDLDLPILIIPTDLEDPLITYNVLGFGTYWLDPTHDDIMYLLGSEKLIEQAKHLGITNVKPVSGMIINKKFTELKNSKAQLRQELGIPLDTKVVLFLFGSCASMEMVELFKIMQKHPEYYCVFICGKAVNIKSKLEELDKDKKCKILGFVNNVEEWMKLSDVCVGKPGPGVISECMASGIPIVIKDGIDVMLQEKYNVEYIKEKGVGETLKNWKELPKLLQSILQNYDKYTQTFAALPKNNALDEVCEVVREVVGD